MDLELRRQEMNQALEMLQERYGLRLIAAQQVESLNETVTQTRAVLMLIEIAGWKSNIWAPKGMEGQQLST